MIETDSYTTTLASGQDFQLTLSADFGQIFIAGLLLALLAALVFDFIFKRAYGRNG